MNEKNNPDTRRKVEQIIRNLDRASKNDIHIPSIQFEDWWKENADLYIKDIDLLQTGCFSHCTDNRITDTAADIVDRIYDQPDTDMINTTMIFLQYLYEKYKLEPMDCEILGQLIIVGLNMQTKFAAESICKTMLGDDFDIESMLSDGLQKQKRSNVIDITESLTPEGRTMKKSFTDSKASYARSQEQEKECRETSKNKALELIDDFLRKYFHPRIEVCPDGARPSVICTGLIILYDPVNNRIIDKNNCCPDYLPKMINGKMFAYPVIDIITNAVDDIMRKSKCFDALQEVAYQYMYSPNDLCTCAQVQQALNKKLDEYINSPAMFRGDAGLRFAVTSITKTEMSTRL